MLRRSRKFHSRYLFWQYCQYFSQCKHGVSSQGLRRRGLPYPKHTESTVSLHPLALLLYAPFFCSLRYKVDTSLILVGNAFSARLILRALAYFVEKDVDGAVLVAFLLAAAGYSDVAED